MNERQERALKRRNKIQRQETIGASIVLVMVGLLVIIALGLLVNTVLGDRGLVCQQASPEKAIELGCK